MIALEFSSFENRYAGQTAWIVGRGPTLFDYRELEKADGPVIFINDAVNVERYLRPDHPSFFFGMDESMRRWLPDIRSTAVLPHDHPGWLEDGRPILNGPDDPILAKSGSVILFRRFGALENEHVAILRASRAELAAAGQLLLLTGTIHTALHFAWYIGCPVFKLIGCDSIGLNYDPRLANRSETGHDKAAGTIKRFQDQIIQQLGIEARYLGTPTFSFRLGL